jgi:hypothetical protein
VNSVIVSAITGFIAGAIGGVAADFVQKPLRAFFDLKKESLQLLIRYSNVSARDESA